MISILITSSFIEIACRFLYEGGDTAMFFIGRYARSIEACWEDGKGRKFMPQTGY
jgi:hypothetical protein